MPLLYHEHIPEAVLVHLETNGGCLVGNLINGLFDSAIVSLLTRPRSAQPCLFRESDGVGDELWGLMWDD